VNGVYWIYGHSSVPLAPAPPGSAEKVAIPLAIVLCPRGGRHLAGEMSYLKRAGIQTLVSLLSDEQVEMLDLSEEGMEARRLGIAFLHHPIPDHQLPTNPQAFRSFVAALANRLLAGESIGIHCWGSIGRATVTAACTLIHLGWPAATALAAVEAARGCPVPDTEEQEQWILGYEAQL
jgi:protein-tyrosine phosphatase